MPQYFTRAEADALLPQLEPIMRELTEFREALREVEVRVEALQLRMRGNGYAHRGELSQLRQDATQLVESINQRVQRVNEWGVLVKDLETGLVDFPSLRDGREVYLCWRLGESRVAWWHSIEGGFAGRQPLDD